jgi:hypothetical protein
MSNLNPIQTQAFKDQQYQGYVEDWLKEPLAKQVTGIKLPLSIYEGLRCPWQPLRGIALP